MMSKLTLFVVMLTLSAQALAKEWAFDVFLDKTKIGTHTFTLNEQNQLVSRAKFNVKILFIEAYSYQHTAKEQWQNDCLATVEADTKENKVHTVVSGKLNREHFEINNGAQKQTLPACVMTFAYWNPKILTQNKLLNPQNAEFLDTQTKLVGKESIEVKGQKIPTSHYLLQGSMDGKVKLNIDLWYDEKNQWVALQSTTPEDYKINYKLK